jgi:acetyltransferase-like isoleucine patch superfamily enzyme
MNFIKNVIASLRKRFTAPSGTICYGDGSNLTIGRNVSFGGRVVLFGTAPIEIGDNTMIALNVIIHTSSHDYHDHPMWTKRIDRPVKIGSHVWIGAAAIILPGVIVEDYAVIGSGSVVTANVPKGAIVAGNPARIIKYRDPSYYEKAPGIADWSQSRIVRENYLTTECKGFNRP